MQPNSKDSNPNPNLPQHLSRKEALQQQTRIAAGAASVLRLLVGLRPIMTVLPEAQAVRAALRLHELLDVGHPALSCRVLDVLSAMLSSAMSALPPRAVAESVARLLQSERGRQARELVGGGRVRGGGMARMDVACVRAVVQCVFQAVVRLQGVDEEACEQLLPATFSTLIGEG